MIVSDVLASRFLEGKSCFSEFKTMDDWIQWLLGSLMLAFLVVQFWSAIRGAKAEKGALDKAWSEFAQQNGLAFRAGDWSMGGVGFAFNKPTVQGSYRSRDMSLSIVFEKAAVWGWGFYESSSSLEHARISLKINNHAKYSLKIQERKKTGVVARMFGRRNDADAIEIFDSRFLIEGSPPEFARSAMKYFNPMTIQRPVMPASRSIETSASRWPFIMLKGDDLIWQQFGTLNDASEVTDLLNRLCDLADFVEEGR